MKGVSVMNIADRIQNLRKAKGISQEELADKVGVSRQAVSKWESEQSIPDIDKVIIMSDYFDVTTDYLLRGIENEKQVNETPANANIFAIVATALNFIGLIMASAVWYEEQSAMAVVIGLIIMTVGSMVFGIGQFVASQNTKEKAKRGFWMVNIWILAFIPLSFIYNVIFSGSNAPYPLYGNPLIAFPIFWVIYISICLGILLMQVRISRKK